MLLQRASQLLRILADAGIDMNGIGPSHALLPLSGTLFFANAIFSVSLRNQKGTCPQIPVCRQQVAGHHGVRCPGGSLAFGGYHIDFNCIFVVSGGRDRNRPLAAPPAGFRRAGGPDESSLLRRGALCRDAVRPGFTRPEWTGGRVLNSALTDL
ncbi:hypothetical protein [Chachezhania sediminis]|uniref:hypothetical protein n=1 Tax=Chachezhania sediminis TaxID=2599291 RepID=UPI001E38DCB6|nr:hypothetical protein [Chachezhania sediminis]